MMVPPRIKIGSQSDPLYLMLVLFVAQGRFPLEIRRVIDCFLLLPRLRLEVLALFVKKKCVFSYLFSYNVLEKWLYKRNFSEKVCILN